ncbi:hypothetical protein P4S88_17080 [Anoxybacillus geothermalis]|nr:hypothetical protein [Anoxybacillus geothermalis]
MTKMKKVIIITSALLLSACSSSNEKEQAFITSKEQSKSNVSVTNNPALHHKVYLTKKDDYDKENQNSIFPFYTTHLFEQHCYHVCL